jgi:hypothetical protein
MTPEVKKNVFVLNSVACEWFFFSLFDSSVQTVAYR